MAISQEYRTIDPTVKAVSICPYCGASKPYTSKLDSLIQCTRQSCRRTFEVIPNEKNWKLFREYEQSQKVEMQDQMEKRRKWDSITDLACTRVWNEELTQREAAKMIGVSLGKFNNLYKEYKQKRLIDTE